MVADAHVLDDLDPFDLLDVESARVDSFLSTLPPDGWSAPTRCVGWTVRDLLAHLATLEEYNQACLDDAVQPLLDRARAAGATDMDAFNAWGVAQRRDVATPELLRRWREDNATFRRQARRRGRGGWLDTAAGRYPVGLQVCYVAIEYATHADDVDAPVGADEREGRTAWRARFTRYALAEYERPVSVRWQDGHNLVEVGGDRVLLSDAQLVEAAVGRLARATLPDRVLAALSCLA